MRSLAFGAPALLVGPPGWVTILNRLHEGRDLTGIFLSGLTVFILAGVSLVLAGVRRRESALGCPGAGIIVSTLVCLVVGSVGEMWMGGATLTVTVRVIDAESGQPIANANVRLVDVLSEPPGTKALTDPDGIATLRQSFTATGHSSPVADTGGFYLGTQILSVAVPGYKDVERPLTQSFDEHRSYRERQLTTIEIALMKASH
jgi:hypothetical protein